MILKNLHVGLLRKGLKHALKISSPRYVILKIYAASAVARKIAEILPLGEHPQKSNICSLKRNLWSFRKIAEKNALNCLLLPALRDEGKTRSLEKSSSGRYRRSIACS